MSFSQSFLPEFDAEMASTRRMLERVPEDKLTWKPHDKSMALGRLAGHVAEMAGWAHTTVTTDTLELTPDMKPFVATSTADLVQQFDKNVEMAREALQNLKDEALGVVWTLIYNGKKVMSMPRGAVLRGVVMSHLVHHRGQLSVYLRLLDVPVPGMYGPSADEGSGF